MELVFGLLTAKEAKIDHQDGEIGGGDQEEKEKEMID